MPHKPRLAKSVRVYLRREKARIRVAVSDEKEQEQKIEELMRKFLVDPSTRSARSG